MSAIVTLAVAIGFLIGISIMVIFALGGTDADDPMQQVVGDAPGFSAEQLREISHRSMQDAAQDPLRRSFARRAHG